MEVRGWVESEGEYYYKEPHFAKEITFYDGSKWIAVVPKRRINWMGKRRHHWEILSISSLGRWAQSQGNATTTKKGMAECDEWLKKTLRMN